MSLTWTSKSEFITRESLSEIREKLSPIYDYAHCSSNYNGYCRADEGSEKSTNNSIVKTSNHGYHGNYYTSCNSNESSDESSEVSGVYDSCNADKSSDNSDHHVQVFDGYCATANSDNWRSI